MSAIHFSFRSGFETEMNVNYDQDAALPLRQAAPLSLYGGGDSLQPLFDASSYPFHRGYLFPRDFTTLPPSYHQMPIFPPSALSYQPADCFPFLSPSTSCPEAFPFVSAGTAPTFNYQKSPVIASKKRATSLAAATLKDAPRSLSLACPSRPVPLSGEIYSRKVFIGGLPIDIAEEEVGRVFGMFGKVVIDWPRRSDVARLDSQRNRAMNGYVFIVFEEEAAVGKLLAACYRDNDRYYLLITSRTMRDKPVQVRPWLLSDADYFPDDRRQFDARRTLFIGGVPRPTRSQDLAESLTRLYGPVTYVGIDIDPELKYPKGAARVTFATAEAYISAIIGRFVFVSHAESEKRVEIKPYIVEEQMCDECHGNQCMSRYAPYFCGDSHCLQYYCEACWDRIHYLVNDNFHLHCPMIRSGDQTKVLQYPPHHNGRQNSRYHRSHILRF